MKRFFIISLTTLFVLILMCFFFSCSDSENPLTVSNTTALGTTDIPTTSTVCEKRHSVPEWKIIESPTCTQNGKKEGECTACKQKITLDIYKTGHSVDSTKEKMLCTVCSTECELWHEKLISLANADNKKEDLLSAADGMYNLPLSELSVYDASRFVNYRHTNVKHTGAVGTSLLYFNATYPIERLIPLDSNHVAVVYKVRHEDNTISYILIVMKWTRLYNKNADSDHTPFVETWLMTGEYYFFTPGLSSASFKDLKIGDSAEQLFEIDPSSRLDMSPVHLTYTDYARYEDFDSDYLYMSYRLLSDGLLLIELEHEYGDVKNPDVSEFTVANMTFFPYNDTVSELKRSYAVITKHPEAINGRRYSELDYEPKNNISTLYTDIAPSKIFGEIYKGMPLYNFGKAIYQRCTYFFALESFSDDGSEALFCYRFFADENNVPFIAEISYDSLTVTELYRYTDPADVYYETIDDVHIGDNVTDVFGMLGMPDKVTYSQTPIFSYCLPDGKEYDIKFSSKLTVDKIVVYTGK